MLLSQKSLGHRRGWALTASAASFSPSSLFFAGA